MGREKSWHTREAGYSQAQLTPPSARGVSVRRGEECSGTPVAPVAGPMATIPRREYDDLSNDLVKNSPNYTAQRVRMDEVEEISADVE